MFLPVMPNDCLSAQLNQQLSQSTPFISSLSGDCYLLRPDANWAMNDHIESLDDLVRQGRLAEYRFIHADEPAILAIIR